MDCLKLRECREVCSEDRQRFGELALYCTQTYFPRPQGLQHEPVSRMLDPSTAALLLRRRTRKTIRTRRTRRTGRTRKKRRSPKIKARTARSQKTKRIGLGGIFWSDGLLPTKLRTCHVFFPPLIQSEGHVTWKTKTLQRVKHYPKRSVFFWSLSWNLALPKSQTFGQFWRCEGWCEEKTKIFLIDASTGSCSQPVFTPEKSLGLGSLKLNQFRADKNSQPWSVTLKNLQVSHWKNHFKSSPNLSVPLENHQLSKGHIFTKGFSAIFSSELLRHGRRSQKVKMKLIVPCWQVSISKS